MKKKLDMYGTFFVTYDVWLRNEIIKKEILWL